MLKIDHNAGFFSCFTVRLEEILDYFNKHQLEPNVVDSSKQFYHYKHNINSNITNTFIKNPSNNIITYKSSIHVTNMPDEQQFSDYHKLNYEQLQPFIDKYFSVSSQIEHKIVEIEDNMGLTGLYDHMCVIFYRGLAKYWETQLAPYEEFLNKANQILLSNKSTVFLLQSDETEFIEYMSKNLHAPIITLTQYTHHISKNLSETYPDVERILPRSLRINHAINFLSIVKIMSKSKHIITCSNNVGLWICLYRGNANGVHQYLKPKELIYGIKNKSYNPDQLQTWFEK